MLVAKQYTLSRQRTLHLLDEIAAKPGIAISVYMPGELSPVEIEKLLPATNLPQVREIAGLAASSKTGGVFFGNQSQSFLILPPYPVREKLIIQGSDVEPLRENLAADRSIAIILVRLGSFAVGLARGETLIASKVGTGLIHSRQRQGGSSSNRFRKRRENQIDAFLERVCEHARDKLAPYARETEYLLFGGARTTINLLRKDCRFLEQFKCPELPPLLDIPDPRQPVLEAAIGRIWSSRIYEWSEPASLQAAKKLNKIL